MTKSLFTGLAATLAVVAGPAFAQHLNGAGATFPAPIYTKWFSEYKGAHPDVQINYQPNGSAGGIKALQDGTVDFGASDMPMTDAQLGPMKVKPLHFPTVLGGVVLTYNVAGISAPLKFSGDVIAGMYLGDIKKWNDPKIAADNPGVKLPGDDIVIVHRSDGSGTTFVFADYLSKVSPTWKSKVGANTSISWPTGVGQPKNDGVAGFVKQTPGAIGYVELIYAVENKMSYAQVKNAAGKYVTASFDSVTQAAANSKDLATDFRGSITNAAGAGSYPISTYTWLLIPSHFDDAAKKKAITDFLTWMVGPGQKEAQPLSYAPLPKKIADLEKKQISDIK